MKYFFAIFGISFEKGRFFSCPFKLFSLLFFPDRYFFLLCQQVFFFQLPAISNTRQHSTIISTFFPVIFNNVQKLEKNSCGFCFCLQRVVVYQKRSNNCNAAFFLLSAKIASESKITDKFFFVKLQWIKYILSISRKIFKASWICFDKFWHLF